MATNQPIPVEVPAAPQFVTVEYVHWDGTYRPFLIIDGGALHDNSFRFEDQPASGIVFQDYGDTDASGNRLDAARQVANVPYDVDNSREPGTWHWGVTQP